MLSYTHSSYALNTGANIVFLCQDNVKVHYHRIHLLNASPVFTAMLSGPMMEAQTGQIEVRRSSQIVQTMLGLIDPARPTINLHQLNSEDLYELYDVLNEYEMSAPMTVVSSHILKHVPIRQSLFDFIKLYNLSWRAIASRWMEMSPEITPEFDFLPPEMIAYCYEYINEPRPIEVWNKVLRWMADEYYYNQTILSLLIILKQSRHILPDDDQIEPLGPRRDTFIEMLACARLHYRIMEQVITITRNDNTVVSIKRRWKNAAEWGRKREAFYLEINQYNESLALQAAEIQNREEIITRYGCCMAKRETWKDFNLCAAICIVIAAILGWFLTLFVWGSALIATITTDRLPFVIKVLFASVDICAIIFLIYMFGRGIHEWTKNIYCCRLPPTNTV